MTPCEQWRRQNFWRGWVEKNFGKISGGGGRISHFLKETIANCRNFDWVEFIPNHPHGYATASEN